jgi:C1A family cysteine protease
MGRFFFVLCILVAPSFASQPWAATQPLDRITGLRVPPNWRTMAPWKSEFAVSSDALPRFFDWRFYAQRLPPVNRQAWNDCWAQGTVGVLESLLKIHFGTDIRMSVQEIISCSGQGSAAQGGYFAHGYHRDRGGVLESVFPYVGRDVRCPKGLSGTHFLARWGYVGQPNRRPTITELKQALMEHGPLGATVTANAALQQFRGNGVFNGCSNAATNHIVVIVGWNDDEGPNGVWFMRNSWGRSHGEDGYAKIPFGCSRLGEIATWADLRLPGRGFVSAIEAE